jgi:hypothetical protein
MVDELDETDFFDVWLTRAEAARYVGAAGESTIRAAETKGLASTTDEAGQVWHRPDVLDEWSWRNEAPPYAQKARVLREAARARHREARTRERQREAEVREEQDEWDTQLARYAAMLDTERRVRADVRRRNERARSAFESAHMDEQTAGRCLGFESYETARRLRNLVERGALRRVESPRELDVVPSSDDVRIVETRLPLCRRGSFYARGDVLKVRDLRALAAPLRAPRLLVSSNSRARPGEDEGISLTLLRMVLAARDG